MPQSNDDYTFDWVYLDPAKVPYQALSEIDRVEFDHLIDLLCRDPWPDGELKMRLTLDDGTEFYLFDNDEWQIIYLPIAGRVLEIWSQDRPQV